MKKLLLTALCAGIFAGWGHAQTEQRWPPELTEVWEPVPPKVTPGEQMAPPSDAIVLFDGSSLDEWEKASDGSPAEWTVAGGAMTVKPGTGSIITKRKFEDFQLHIEWHSPSEVSGESQGRGNSGIFLQNRYEVQVLDNYNNRTYSNGQAASIYKQSIPLVNACKPPGEWQAYDIIYSAPRFNDDGILVLPAYVTVIHNGIVALNHVEIKGPTEYIGLPKYVAHGPDGIQLQDHGNKVGFRNIWIREM